MDELIDVLKSDGTPSGKTCLKSEAHRLGLYHQTIHVWFYTNDGKVLLQKRAAVKKVFPELWDVSVAGHIGAGEGIIDTAIREVEEEIGLIINPSDLFKVGTRNDSITHDNGIIDNEFKHIFVCLLKTPLKELKMQPGEVDDLKLFPSSILKDNSKHGSFMIQNFNGYYDFIYDKLTTLIH